MFTPIANPIARTIFTEEASDMALMLGERVRMEAELDAQIQEVEHANFHAQMQSFETQIEDEDIAYLIQAARELAIEEDATAALRRAWETGLAA